MNNNEWAMEDGRPTMEFASKIKEKYKKGDDNMIDEVRKEKYKKKGDNMDKIRKQKIGNKEYSFKMMNKTIRKIDEKYGNYGTVIYGLMEGEKVYSNALKLVSMSCIEKEWNIEELEDIMTGQEYQQIMGLGFELYLDYMGLNDLSDEEEKKDDEDEKN